MAGLGDNNRGGLGIDVGKRSQTYQPEIKANQAKLRAKKEGRPWAEPCTNASYPSEGFVPKGSILPAMKTIGRAALEGGKLVGSVAVCTASVGAGLAVMAVFDGPEIIKKGASYVGGKVVYAVAELVVKEDYESAGKNLD